MDQFSVVIVDDEKWALVYLKSLFDCPMEGFKVIAACRQSAEALEIVKKEKPDVLITDIHMPGMSGLEFLEYIRDMDISCEAVIVSGFTEFAYAQKALGLGVCEYLVKPVSARTAGELRQKLKKRLSGKQIPFGSTVEGINPSLGEESNFHRLCSYIEKNFTQRLYLKDLVREFGIAPNYCCSLFAREKGMTFSQYVTRLRMERALTLLNTSGLGINKIALMIGFDDYAYFERVFKRYYERTPTECRLDGQGGR